MLYNISFQLSTTAHSETNDTLETRRCFPGKSQYFTVSTQFGIRNSVTPDVSSFDEAADQRIPTTKEFFTTLQLHSIVSAANPSHSRTILNVQTSQWQFYAGAGGTGPQNVSQAPQIFGPIEPPLKRKQRIYAYG